MLKFTMLTDCVRGCQVLEATLEDCLLTSRKQPHKLNNLMQQLPFIVAGRLLVKRSYMTVDDERSCQGLATYSAARIALTVVLIAGQSGTFVLSHSILPHAPARQGALLVCRFRLRVETLHDVTCRLSLSTAVAPQVFVLIGQSAVMMWPTVEDMAKIGLAAGELMDALSTSHSVEWATVSRALSSQSIDRFLGCGKPSTMVVPGTSV